MWSPLPYPLARRLRTMNSQADLFAAVDSSALDAASLASPAPKREMPLRDPIAVPCGFVDRSNNRCRRLGRQPIFVDGVPLTSRGRPLVHCVPECWNGSG